MDTRKFCLVFFYLIKTGPSNAWVELHVLPGQELAPCSMPAQPFYFPWCQGRRREGEHSSVRCPAGSSLKSLFPCLAWMGAQGPYSASFANLNSWFSSVRADRVAVCCVRKMNHHLTEVRAPCTLQEQLGLPVLVGRLEARCIKGRSG